MEHRGISLLFGGDMSVGENSEFYFQGVSGLLAAADVRMAQLEEPFCKEESEFVKSTRTTRVLEPLAGRFDLLTLSGNHFYDFGEQGVSDTIEWCSEKGIVTCGGGSDLAQAERPGFFEKGGVKFGVLAYNAIGPKSSFAGEHKGGTAYVDFHRAYEPLSEVDGHIGAKLENDVWQVRENVEMNGVCRALNLPDWENLDRFAAQVYAARRECDILIVYFHKGGVHRPVEVAPYERFISHLAIDNGADAVIGTHSHVAHGIEFYKGKAIYHGLNNFIMWVPQLSPGFKGEVKDSATSDNAAWIKARVKRFGFVPDPDYPTYPFRPESVYCYVAKLVVKDKKVASYRVIPMKVEKDGVPYVHGHTETGQECLDFLEEITRGAGFDTRYQWSGDEIIVSEGENIANGVSKHGKRN